MTFSDPRALRYLSQFLLVYLLGLHLVGAPLHRHMDSVPDKDSVAVVTANDACPLCDWLVQPSLVIADSCFAAEALPLFELLNAAISTQRVAVWTGFSGGSRAPPAA